MLPAPGIFSPRSIVISRFVCAACKAVSKECVVLLKSNFTKLSLPQFAAKNKALANSAKGKTQTPTAEAARRRNLNK